MTRLLLVVLLIIALAVISPDRVDLAAGVPNIGTLMESLGNSP